MLVKRSIIYNYCERKIRMKKGNSKTSVRVIESYGCPNQLRSREVNLSYLGRVPIKCVKLLIMTLSN